MILWTLEVVQTCAVKHKTYTTGLSLSDQRCEPGVREGERGRDEEEGRGKEKGEGGKGRKEGGRGRGW